MPLCAGTNQSAIKDWTARKFAKMLSVKEPHYRISDAYEMFHITQKQRWNSEQEHIINWLKDYNGPGIYNRKSRGLTARLFYNHFQCTSGLLWVAEAVGENSTIVERAAPWQQNSNMLLLNVP